MPGNGEREGREQSHQPASWNFSLGDIQGGPDAEHDVSGGGDKRHAQAVPDGIEYIRIPEKRCIVVEGIRRGENLPGPASFLCKRDQHDGYHRQKQERQHGEGCCDGNDASGPAANGCRWGGDSFCCTLHTAPAAAFQHEQKQQAYGSQQDRDSGRQGEVAIRLVVVNLQRQETLGAGEKERRRKGRHRDHENKQGCSGKRWSQLRQDHAPERRGSGGAQVCGSFRQALVHVAEGRQHEQVEVDVHGVDMHEPDGGEALECKRRFGEAEHILKHPREDAAFAVQEEKGKHAYEGRQRKREDGNRHQCAAQREPEAMKTPGQRRAQYSASEHGRHRNEYGIEQGPYVCRRPGRKQSGVVFYGQSQFERTQARV